MSRHLISLHGVRSEERLQSVVTEMKHLGVPTIRVVDCGDTCAAVEGTHRLRAAWSLGLPVHLDVIGQNDLVDLTWMDILDNFPDGTVTMPAGEIALALRDPYGNGCYRVKEDGRLDLLESGI